MSDTNDKRPKSKQSTTSSAGRSASPGAIGQELGGDLDFEPDALLDSLLGGDDAPTPMKPPEAKPPEGVPAPRATRPEGDVRSIPPGTVDEDEFEDFDDEDPTGVIELPPLEDAPGEEEFTEVDDLLSSPPPAPARPLPPVARAVPPSKQKPALSRPVPLSRTPVSKHQSGSRTPSSTQTKPLPNFVQTSTVPRPGSRVPRPATPQKTATPPAVNPAGLPAREPFPLAHSPEPPRGRVTVDSEDEFFDQPTLADIPQSEVDKAKELEAEAEQAWSASKTAGEDTDDVEDTDEDLLESIPPEAPSEPFMASVPPSQQSMAEVGRPGPAPTIPDAQALEEFVESSEDLLDSIPDEALGVADNERPARDHLDEAGLTDAWRDRADWFWSEAQATADPAAKARLLLMSSEHYAMVGDISRAREVAGEIHAVQPAMSMSSRQNRWLAAVELDYKAVAGILELETRASPTPEARAHAANYSADIHRVALGDEQNARRKLDLASRVLPGDPRPHLMKLCEQLATSPTPPKLRWPDNDELASLAPAVDEIVRLRGGKGTGEENSTFVSWFETARRALAHQDLGTAATALKALADAPGMTKACLWLASALSAHSQLTRPQAIEILKRLVTAEGSSLARRALAARALEQDDAEAIRTAIYDGEVVSSEFDRATRIVLAALTGTRLPGTEDGSNGGDLAESLAPLEAAAQATHVGLDVELARTVGDEAAREAVRLGRALAYAMSVGGTERAGEEQERGAAAWSRLKRAVPAEENTGIPRPLAEMLGLEFALRSGDSERVAQILSRWQVPGGAGASGALASALLREMNDNKLSARIDYMRALELDPQHEGAVRALLADSEPAEAAEMLAKLSDTSTNPANAGLMLLEAALRRTDDPAKAEELLVQAATSAPELPLIYLHGERQARQRGDADLLLNWLRQRRDTSPDPIDQAFDFVREALLVAETDMELAASLLGDAVTARPEDMALRELHERLARQAGVERGKWREDVAAKLEGAPRLRLLAAASLEYERAGEIVEARRVLEEVAEASQSPLARLACERLETLGPDTTRQSEAWLKAARAEEDVDVQRELYERLSELDERRGDHSSAVLWQTAILERSPDYLPALRRLEHEYITSGRWDELEQVAGQLAKKLDPAEADAHAIWAAQHRILGGDWEGARPLIELACKREQPTLWALRALAAQARAADEPETGLRVTLELLEHVHAALDIATLSLRGAEAATRLGKLDAARALLQRAIQQAPTHLVALTTLADVLEEMGAIKEAAEALEAAATAYRVPEHQVEAWLQAAVLWQDRVNDTERAIQALEEATERDVTHADAFERLHSIYLARGETSKVAELLERRLAHTTDPDERVGIEVMRGRALAGVGEKQAAKRALAAALDANPDHAGALEAFADLCVEEGDWVGAEGAWIRLARHVTSPERQVAIYKKLGALYDDQLPNPERAELAYNEVLKRKPEDVQARERLVLVYGNLGRADKAAELQQSLIEQATSPEQERDRTLELALVYEQVAQDPRRALSVLDAARKRYGHDARVLRALAEYYQRQGDERTLAMLLDRSANDSRRALSTGRFDASFFEVMATVSELRGASDAALVARATLSALEGDGAEILGAGTRAGDVRLEDLLAPSALSPALRHLLKKAGDILDAAYPVDLRALKAQPISPQTDQFAGHVQQVAGAFGINGIGIFVSPALGPTCMPVSSTPPRIVYGQGLLTGEQDVARYFLLVRALKILQAGAATLARTAPVDLWPLMAGFLSLLAPSWTPQGADPKKTAMAAQRLRSAMTGELDGDAPVLALEVIGAIGNRASQLATATHQFGNRAGLLAVGNPSAAIEGIALASGQGRSLPASGPDRMKWIVRNPEARDVAVFSVSDQYVQARAALGVSEQ